MAESDIKTSLEQMAAQLGLAGTSAEQLTKQISSAVEKLSILAEEAAKTAKSFGTMGMESGAVDALKQTAEQVSKMVEASTRIEESTRRWTTMMDENSNSLREQIEFMTGLGEGYQILRVNGEMYNNLERMNAQIMREENELIETRLQSADSIFVQAKRSMDLKRDELALSKPNVVAGGRTVDDVGRHLSDVESLPQKILSNMPMGGLLGFFLMGLSKESEFRASTQQAVQAFDVLGGGGQKFAGHIQSLIKDLQKDFIASAADIRAISGAFAGMGVHAEEAWGKHSTAITKSMGLSTGSLAETSLALDKLNEVGAGTFASLIGSGVKDFGNTLDGVTKTIVNYSMAAQHAGQSSVQFLSDVMQSAGQLKLYNIQLDDVAAKTLQVVQAGHNRGLNDAFAGTVAQTGVGQALGGIAGMSDGLAAMIGQKVAAKLGTGGDAVDALVQMRHGFRGEADNSILSTTITELAGLAKQAGPSRGHQEFFLQKMGFGVEGAAAILDIAKHTKDNVELSKEDKTRLNHALASEADKTSDMARAMETLKIAVADVAVGLLSLILSGIKTLVQFVQIGVDKIVNPLNGDEDRRKEANDAIMLTALQMDAASGQLGRGEQGIVESIKKLGGGAAHSMPSGLFEDWSLRFGDDQKSRRKTIGQQIAVASDTQERIESSSLAPGVKDALHKTITAILRDHAPINATNIGAYADTPGMRPSALVEAFKQVQSTPSKATARQRGVQYGDVTGQQHFTIDLTMHDMQGAGVLLPGNGTE